jgi:hypothetical protein
MWKSIIVILILTNYVSCDEERNLTKTIEELKVNKLLKIRLKHLVRYNGNRCNQSTFRTETLFYPK